MALELVIYEKNSLVEVKDYEKVKEEIGKVLVKYKDKTITKETFSEAKDDRAKLNSTIKLIDDVRIAKDKEIALKLAYQGQLKDLVKEIKEVASTIDSQVKDLEVAFNEEKLNTIKEFYEFLDKDFDIPLDSIFNDKWYNKTFTLEKIQAEIHERLDTISKDLEVLRKLYILDENRLNRSLNIYQKKLDLNATIKEEELHYELEKDNVVFTKQEVDDNAKQIEEDKVIRSVRFEVSGNKRQLDALSKCIKDLKLKVSILK